MKKQLFNDNWKFYRVGEQEEAKNISLPHDAMIYEKRSPEAPSGDGEAFFEVGNYVYEKQIGVDAKNACLEFDGVYKDAKVYLNDELKKEYHYGYAPFVVELGEVKQKDIIKVECGIAASPDSRWYPGAGIYRDVNLYTSDDNEYVKVNGIKVTTLDYAKGLINVKVDAENAEIEILDNNKVVGKANGSDVDITIDNPNLWDENNPYLYTVKVKVGKDVVEDRFGIRQIEKRKNGLYLNGKKILLRGGCIHHDNGLLGAATYYKSEYRRVKKLKEAGFNAIRSSHNPASKYLLRACDELGVYVMDETWDMWFHKKTIADYGGKLWREHHNEDIENMINRDFNHPSVILYSIGNEVSEPAKQEGLEVTKQMVDLIHELDPNRLVTAGFNLMIIYNASRGKGIYNEEGGRNDDGGQKMAGMNSTMFNMITSMVGTSMNKSANSKKADAVVSPVLDLLDVAGYNYASGRYKLDKDLHPDRLIFGSETFPHTIDENWKMVEELDNVVGDFVWTAWDYIGENGIGTWSYIKGTAGFSKPYPWWLADVGAFDIIGRPNAEAYWISACFNYLDKPAITIQPINHDIKPYKGSWRGSNGIDSYAWKGCEGKKAICEVFFKCAKVELYQNDKKVGTGKPKGSRTIFKIKYVPGKLVAVAYDNNGNELARNELVSANNNLNIKLNAEEDTINLNDIVYVGVDVVDDNGVLESNNDLNVKLDVENGELLAFGSANPCTQDDLHSGQYSTYYGKALAIIKANKKGDIVVKASSDNLSDSIIIKVK